MTVNDLIENTGWAVIAGRPDSLITSGYVCDMLSWAMAHGQKGTAWITVQTHLNVVAVASLLEFSCVIIPEKIQISMETINAANDKDVCILGAPCTSYGAVSAMAQLGIGEV